MPVFAMAYARPNIPLPMMAFIRLKTEEAKEAPLALVRPDPCVRDRTKRINVFIYVGVFGDCIRNNWPVFMMDDMKLRCSGMWDQGMEMGMDGLGFERLVVGQLPELRINCLTSVIRDILQRMSGNSGVSVTTNSRRPVSHDI